MVTKSGGDSAGVEGEAVSEGESAPLPRELVAGIGLGLGDGDPLEARMGMSCIKYDKTEM